MPAVFAVFGIIAMGFAVLVYKVILLYIKLVMIGLSAIGLLLMLVKLLVQGAVEPMPTGGY